MSFLEMGKKLGISALFEGAFGAAKRVKGQQKLGKNEWIMGAVENHQLIKHARSQIRITNILHESKFGSSDFSQCTIVQNKNDLNSLLRWCCSIRITFQYVH